MSYPIGVQVDNNQAISFQRSTCLTSKMRGIIDMRWAWVQELRDRRKIRVKKVDTDLNKADVLTKCMPAYKFHSSMKAIRGDQESRLIANFVDKIVALQET